MVVAVAQSPRAALLAAAERQAELTLRAAEQAVGALLSRIQLCPPEARFTLAVLRVELAAARAELREAHRRWREAREAARDAGEVAS